MNNKTPKTDLSKLKILYLETDLNLKEIGKELNVSFKIVKKWIKYLDIHRTPEHQLRVEQRRYKKRKENLINKYGVDNVAKLELPSKKGMEILNIITKSKIIKLEVEIEHQVNLRKSKF